MLRRILFEDWHLTLPMFAFLFFSGLFCYLLVRTIRMKRSRAEELSRLPLEEDPSPPPPSETDEHR